MSGETSHTWVFGYGSLASPASLGRTLGRDVSLGDDAFPAVLDGFARRWNYGSPRDPFSWDVDGHRTDAGVLIFLGIVAAAGDRTNGVVAEVSDDELGALDRRERDYDRVEVTRAVAWRNGSAAAHRVVTYVPRPSSLDRYERARDERRAAVRRAYWDLCHEAFGALGRAHLDHFLTTPEPDVPILEIDLP